MKKLITPFIGLITMMILMFSNYNYADNDYGLKENNLFLVQATTTGSTDETGGTGGEKIKTCRSVDCTGTWTGTADANGCITIFGKKMCNFSANLKVTFTYFGRKENCAGGSDWYDCDACQKDCVPSET